MRRRSAISGLVLSTGLALSACLPTVTTIGPVPEAAPFPECMEAPLAFQGETTLAAIGLAEFVAPNEASQAASVWVTAVPVSLGGPGEDASDRIVCVQWPDGSGMAMPIPDDWAPPNLLDGDLADEATDGPPIGLLAVSIGIVLVIGISFLAFRREAPVA
jgi:hypothetical protein